MPALGKILVCGIGPSAEVCLPEVKNSQLIISRGLIAESWLNDRHIFSEINLISNDEGSLGTCKKMIHEKILQVLDVCYVTPVSPFQLDVCLRTLADNVNPTNIKYIGSANIMDRLPLNAYKEGKLVKLDAYNLARNHHPPFSSDDNVLIFEPTQVPHLVDLLTRIYYPDTRVFTFGLTNRDQKEWVEEGISVLESSDNYISALFIPAQTRFTSLESFEETIAYLRSPKDGCPWDKKQTHASLRTYLLEETYEALDALDRSDISDLKEELGDLLLQILLHAEIAIESKEFNMRDVINGINRKLIYRHPHVFNDWKVKDEGDVIQNWEDLKEQERFSQNGEERTGLLDSVPLAFPALAQAQAIQSRAARVGFDWPEIEPLTEPKPIPVPEEPIKEPEKKPEIIPEIEPILPFTEPRIKPEVEPVTEPSIPSIQPIPTTVPSTTPITEPGVKTSPIIAPTTEPQEKPETLPTPEAKPMPFTQPGFVPYPTPIQQPSPMPSP